MLGKLQEINRLRDEGKISADEAQKRKYKLVLEEDKKHIKEEVEFDKGCTS